MKKHRPDYFPCDLDYCLRDFGQDILPWLQEWAEDSESDKRASAYLTLDMIAERATDLGLIKTEEAS